MIRHVTRWSNGMVTVFDENGQQLPEYQGKYEDVREKILRDAPPDAEFNTGAWNQYVLPKDRQYW